MNICNPRPLPKVTAGFRARFCRDQELTDWEDQYLRADCARGANHRGMSNQRFLYCHNCNAVHRVTPYDTAPIFETDGAEIQEIPRDDHREFLNRHVGHKIGELIGVDEEHGKEDRFADPMRTHHIVVTDGRETFVVRSFRHNIAEPLTYEVLPRELTFEGN